MNKFNTTIIELMENQKRILCSALLEYRKSIQSLADKTISPDVKSIYQSKLYSIDELLTEMIPVIPEKDIQERIDIMEKADLHDMKLE